MAGDITVYVRPPQEAGIASMVTKFKSVILLLCFISVNGYCLLYLYAPTEDTDHLNHTILHLLQNVFVQRINSLYPLVE